MDQLRILSILADISNDRLIEAGWCQVDHVHRAGEFLVLAGRHLTGNENAQVADALMQAVDDRLTVSDDLLVILIQVGDPAQSLLWWSDIITPGAEDDDGRTDVA